MPTPFDVEIIHALPREPFRHTPVILGHPSDRTLGSTAWKTAQHNRLIVRIEVHLAMVPQLEHVRFALGLC